MTKPTRELTTEERRSIRKLVTKHCANHDSEYGCLPLDCECPMLGICYTNSAMCRYFREAARNWKRPCSRCPQDAANAAGNRSRSMGAESTALTTARKHPGKSRPQPECANSGAKRQCNALALKVIAAQPLFMLHLRRQCSYTL